MSCQWNRYVCRKSADRHLNYVSRRWEYTLEGNKEHKTAEHSVTVTLLSQSICVLWLDVQTCYINCHLLATGRKPCMSIADKLFCIYTYAYKYVLSRFSWVCRSSHLIARHLLPVVGLYFIHVAFSQLAAGDGVSLTFLGSVSSHRFSGDFHTRFLVSILIIINNLEQGKLNMTWTTKRMNYRIVDFTTQ